MFMHCDENAGQIRTKIVYQSSKYLRRTLTNQHCIKGMKNL